MSAISEIRLGISTYIGAFSFVRKHNFWKYILIPGIINIFLIIGVYILSVRTGDFLREYIFSFFNLATDSWWAKLTGWMFSFLIKLSIFLIYGLIYKYLVLIIMSPIMAYVSEKTEEIISGKTHPFNLLQFSYDVFRGIGVALRNIFFELLFVFLFWLLSFIPLVGLISAIMIFLIQSYYYGYSMIDYYNERQRISIKQSSRIIRSHQWFSITNGAFFYLVFLVPFVGWMFAPTIGVVAATLGWVKLENNNQSF